MLSVSNISIFYDSIQAVHEASFSMQEKECIALVGGNGAGKTSTLKAICGLVQPASGGISFFDKDVMAVPAHRRASMGISYVPEGRRVFPAMSVQENLEIGAFIPSARKNVAQLMEMVYDVFPKLKERRKQQGGTLSGGEQQMLAIGRGLMSGSSLLMLDEPSLGLAPKIVDELYDALRLIVKSGTKSILLVEEDIYRAFSLASRGYVFENGRIVLEGSKDDLLSNEYVKRAYIGM